MSQLPQDSSGGSYGWLGWIVPIVVGLGFLWSLIKRFFEFVTRTEFQSRLAEQDEKFKEAVAAQDEKFLDALEKLRVDSELRQREAREEQLRLHRENVDTAKDTAKETFQRISELEKGVSRIDGALSGRFQRIRNDSR